MMALNDAVLQAIADELASIQRRSLAVTRAALAARDPDEESRLVDAQRALSEEVSRLIIALIFSEWRTSPGDPPS